MGGHQKGWAESRADLSEVFESSDWDCYTGKEGKCQKAIDYTEGYPFRNATDAYSDDHLKKLYGSRKLLDKCMTEKQVAESCEIQLQHNLDLHVFGHGEENPEKLPNGFVRLKNGVRTLAEPDVNLLWIVGGNYFGQTNDAQTKRSRLDKRLRVGGKDGERLLLSLIHI